MIQDQCNLYSKGNRLAADSVVLALGHPLPEEPQGLELPGSAGAMSPIPGQPAHSTAWPPMHRSSWSAPG